MGCRATLELMEQGGNISSPLPLAQAVDLDVTAHPALWDRTLADVGMHSAVPAPTARLGGGLSIPYSSPSLQLAFLRAQGALGRLCLPASSRPWWSHPHPHPSSLSGGAGSPAVPGSGAARTAETGGSIAPISTHKQKQQLPSSGLQSAQLIFMWSQMGAGSGSGWGKGQELGRGPARSCGAGRGNVKGCGQGAEQLPLHCDGHKG